MNVGLTVGLGAATILGAPVVVTGAAITGVVWGVSQLLWGDKINDVIDEYIGYR